MIKTALNAKNKSSFCLIGAYKYIWRKQGYNLHKKQESVIGWIIKSTFWWISANLPQTRVLAIFSCEQYLITWNRQKGVLPRIRANLYSCSWSMIPLGARVILTTRNITQAWWLKITKHKSTIGFQFESFKHWNMW